VEQLINSIIVIVLFICIYLIVNRVIKSIIKKTINRNGEKRKKTLLLLVNNIIKYVLMVICLLMILGIYGVNTTALVTSLGLLGLGASLAMQDTLKDLLAGFFIIFENQYDIGDTITIGNFKGEVVALGLKTTKIRAYTGEINIVSNRNIESVINHSSSNSLAIVDFDISYEEDLDKVEKIINQLCKNLTNELTGIKGDVQLLGIEELGESGIRYRVTVDTEAMAQFKIQRIIRKAIKEELTKNGISIPYPQVVVHNE